MVEGEAEKVVMGAYPETQSGFRVLRDISAKSNYLESRLPSSIDMSYSRSWAGGARLSVGHYSHDYLASK